VALVKRIVLHIGSHKTGTTALQDLLAAARPTLLPQGAWYPATDRGPYPHLNKQAAFYWAVRESHQAQAKEMDRMLREADAYGAETLVLSEEGFSVPFYEDYAALRDLKARFDVQVLCVLRRQDEFIESIWNQYCKEGRETRPIATFAQAQRIQTRVNYKELLEFWSGIGDLSVAEYGATKAEGLGQFFTRVTGIALPWVADRVNPSMGMNAALLRSWLNARSYPLDPGLNKLMAFDTRRTALGRTLRRRILSEHAEQNGQIADRFGVVFPDELPEEGDLPLVMPERGFLIRLVLAMVPFPDDQPAMRALFDLPAGDLVLAAKALAESAPQSAMRLALAARAVAPNPEAASRLIKDLLAAPSGEQPAEKM
jgi:hypothetical protein